MPDRGKGFAWIEAALIHLSRRAVRWAALPALLTWLLLAWLPAAGLRAQQSPAGPPAAPRGAEAVPAGPPAPDPPFRFEGRVDLVNVSVTVVDREGRFVPGLTQGDFTVYEDGRPQPITYFSAERVPVSLGVVLDTSGSMAGEKIQSARSALDRFLRVLLDGDDEVFLIRFSDRPTLLQDWTQDRLLLTRALERIAPNGATALYDALAEALPLAQAGSRRKKALLVISDGNDTSSATRLRDLRQQIRESEVLVYAIGIDGEAEPTYRRPPTMPPRAPLPPARRPFPPIRGRGWPPFSLSPQTGPPRPAPVPPRGSQYQGDDRVNAATLRELTDDSGGRTEIVRDPRDLDPATAGIADELSRQYFLAYPVPGLRDGRYHDIRVEVSNPAARVRARRGYVAN